MCIRDRRRTWGWPAFALALGGGLLCKYTAAALAPGALLFVMLHGRRGDRLRLTAAALLALSISAPNLGWNVQAGWPTLHHTVDITLGSSGAQSLRQSLETFSGFVAGQALALAPLALPWFWRLHRQSGPWSRSPAAVLLLGTSLPLLLAGGVQAWRGGAQLNWIAPVHAAAAVGLALAVGAAPGKPRRAVAAALLAQVVLVSALVAAPGVALAVGASWPARFDVWARLRGWPQAFEQLRPALQSHPTALLVTNSRTLAAQAAYHWRSLAVERGIWRAADRPANHYEMVCPWWPGRTPGRPVLLLSEGPVPAAAAVALGPLQVLATARRSGAAPGQDELRLTLLEPAGPGPDRQPVEPPSRWCR